MTAGRCGVKANRSFCPSSSVKTVRAARTNGAIFDDGAILALRRHRSRRETRKRTTVVRRSVGASKSKLKPNGVVGMELSRNYRTVPAPKQVSEDY